MKNHHITKHKKSFFEGWYFKHQSGSNMIAFIPGINITQEGSREAFIQIITKDASCNVKYDIRDFHASRHKFQIKIGNNSFSDKGIHIDINREEIHCRADIRYGTLTPLRYDIMGPFSFIPNMECNHGVMSLFHNIKGTVLLNGTKIKLKNGIGYIEKDWGCSFPKTYTWVQCNGFTKEGERYSVMVSIAEIPLHKLCFRGFLGIVYYRGREYRFATYNGGKILNDSSEGILLKRGRYVLRLTVSSGEGRELKAPGKGSMQRIIKENLSCNSEITLLKNSRTIFAAVNGNTSFERVKASYI